ICEWGPGICTTVINPVKDVTKYTPLSPMFSVLRTGTGDLEVRAGRDLTLAHKESVIYTAGRKDTTVWSDFSTANPNASYGVEGGNLAIGAQGSIEAAPSGQHFTE
ncbi:hypothetical protein C1X31_33850, partial [Pseudomonas sp. GW456-11-11-14-LB2]|uniref:hypothetical protein n=1 Tax=Pseudomonas sp. GW456-11-11-14-LB2 TaxID=2070613 RepID=UPI000CB8C5D5